MYFVYTESYRSVTPPSTFSILENRKCSLKECKTLEEVKQYIKSLEEAKEIPELALTPSLSAWTHTHKIIQGNYLEYSVDEKIEEYEETVKKVRVVKEYKIAGE